MKEAINQGKVRIQIINQPKKLAHMGSVLSLKVEVKGSNLEFDRGKFESSLQSSIIKLVKFWIFNIIHILIIFLLL